MHEYNMPTILLAALPMEVHQMHKFIILALFLVIFANNALAQTVREPAVLRDAGEITGIVQYCSPQGTDGTKLYLQGRSFSVVTGASGNFVFNYVPPGSYNLIIQIPGQPPDSRSVSVTAKQVLDLGTLSFCPDNDGDGYTAANDCNDNNPSIHPGAVENCDGVDNNCNNSVDEGCAVCTDADNDGYKAQASCGTQVDCNDAAPAIHPNAQETCDGIDNNCNGTIDEGFNKSSDILNCGTCGNVCSFSNAAPACSAGVCRIVSCNAGFADCDAQAANGCEKNITTDVANCGLCGNACPVGKACVSGACQ